MIIRSQRMEEQKRLTAAVEVKKSSSVVESEYDKSSRRYDQRTGRRSKDMGITQQDIRREPADVFSNIGDDRNITWLANENNLK